MDQEQDKEDFDMNTDMSRNGDLGSRDGRPWGLGRMARYGSIVPVLAADLVLDPASQTVLRLGVDGLPVNAPGHGSNTGTEQVTSKQTGDGSGPRSMDTDHSQDNDRD